MELTKYWGYDVDRRVHNISDFSTNPSFCDQYKQSNPNKDVVIFALLLIDGFQKC